MTCAAKAEVEHHDTASPVVTTGRTTQAATTGKRGKRQIVKTVTKGDLQKLPQIWLDLAIQQRVQINGSE